jgi:catechol 2,3-dioxygenase-like lactoylglutathione lyase family enzyme
VIALHNRSQVRSISGNAGSMNGDGMTITRLLTQMTVADSAQSEPWYTRLFGRDPDARPMPGLLEWHPTDSFGVQVWGEPDRAGTSCMVLDESDLDGLAARLDQAGVHHEAVQDATTVRVLRVQDPDGNRIVFTGPLSVERAS